MREVIKSNKQIVVVHVSETAASYVGGPEIVLSERELRVYLVVQVIHVRLRRRHCRVHYRVHYRVQRVLRVCRWREVEPWWRRSLRHRGSTTRHGRLCVHVLC